MNEAVFISDLHLHPQEPAILEKFRAFVAWAAINTRSVYILGDFLHVWPGDDAIDAWTGEIIALLAQLSVQGVAVFFMPGNRDFLIGPTFLHQAKMTGLTDPHLINLGTQSVLLSHGDAYCTKDKGHQWFRRLTRNRVFKFFFLSLSSRLRRCLVTTVRQRSQDNLRKLPENMRTVADSMQAAIRSFGAQVLIHGHTHHPGRCVHQDGVNLWEEYILSDWDETPSVLCYNESFAI